MIDESGKLNAKETLPSNSIESVLCLLCQCLSILKKGIVVEAMSLKRIHEDDDKINGGESKNNELVDSPENSNHCKRLHMSDQQMDDKERNRQLSHNDVAIMRAATDGSGDHPSQNGISSKQHESNNTRLQLTSPAQQQQKLEPQPQQSSPHRVPLLRMQESSSGNVALRNFNEREGAVMKANELNRPPSSNSRPSSAMDDLKRNLIDPVSCLKSLSTVLLMLTSMFRLLFRSSSKDFRRKPCIVNCNCVDHN